MHWINGPRQAVVRHLGHLVRFRLGEGGVDGHHPDGGVRSVKRTGPFRVRPKTPAGKGFEQQPARIREAPSSSRTPATTVPSAGSTTSPTAFTAMSAATIRPSGKLSEAEPIPPFIARAMPRLFPTVAPAPAPALPRRTGCAPAAAAAR